MLVAQDKACATPQPEAIGCEKSAAATPTGAA